MRTVTAGLFASVDGVVEAPNRWQFDSFDDELGEELTAVLQRTDEVLLGRVGYEEWSRYWPNASADQGFADFINAVPKHVASRTLSGPLEWRNATLIDGDLQAFVAHLKSTDGGEIAVMGGISLVRQLLVHPVVAGAGRHLFEPADPTTRLALLDSRTTSRGNAVSRYGLRADG